MTANLQKASLTVRQIAQLMNVSERSIYKCKAIMRVRPDLEGPIMAGTMSIDEAHRIAFGRPKPTPLDRLVKAWNAVTDDERAMFVRHVTGVGA